ALERAGYVRPFEHTARTIHLTELLAWDLVLPMTADHAQRMHRMVEQAPEGSTPPEIRMWRRFEPGIPAEALPTEIAVDDPWYEGQGAFDRTIRQMQQSVPGILARARELLEGGGAAGAGRGAPRCPPSRLGRRRVICPMRGISQQAGRGSVRVVGPGAGVRAGAGAGGAPIVPGGADEPGRGEEPDPQSD